MSSPTGSAPGSPAKLDTAVGTVIHHVRQHLIGAGLVRDPRVAGSLPPCWLHPKGAPGPGEGNSPVERHDELVISLFHAGGLPARRFDAARRRDIIDVYLVAAWPTRAVTAAARIRDELIDRTNWQMGGLTIIESSEWRPLQPITDPDRQRFAFLAGVLLETYAADTH